MPKTRLTNHGRDRLRALARELVRAPDARAAADAAYAGALFNVRRLVVDRYPQSDMLILERYDVARRDNCIRLRLTGGGDARFTCRSPDRLPLQPYGFNCRMFIADEAATRAVTAHVGAEQALQAALEARLKKYYALIQTSRNFEDVLAVWPEAERLRSALGAAHLIVGIDNDMIAAIRAEVAERATAVRS